MTIWNLLDGGSSHSGFLIEHSESMGVCTPGINPRQGEYTPQIWNNSTKKRSDLVARISLNDFCYLAHVLLPYLAPTTLLCIAPPRPDVTPPRASLLLCIALPR
jgi:hypothetical protein